MEIRVLGPLTAQENGVSIVPSAGKPRQVLALLAIRANEVMPVLSLMEELWGAEPPRSAPTTLQTYILQLRRRIADLLEKCNPGSGQQAKDVLVTRHGGYLLDVAPGSVDAHEFDRLGAAGSQALEAGDDEAAVRLLRQAQDLWRGPALVDVPVGSRLELEVTRLEEDRLGVLERRIGAEMRLGRHHELLSELAVLAAQHPLHEDLQAQYMIALYRSGRPWRALDVYTRLRDTLVGELGLEPSPRLQRLQRAVLACDPALDERGGRGGRIPEQFAV
jgi:SARP family transcriptional regulator, regulator of embCAB operon